MDGPNTRKARHGELGVTLLETTIAAGILIVGLSAVMAVFSSAAVQTEDQGDESTRATEYSQDKVEQLTSLSFNDGSTDTTVYPPAATGGTGLGGTMAANATVGGTNPTSPATNYVDYLDQNGNLLTSSTGKEYTRVWSISTDSTGNLKTITVVTQAPNPRGPAQSSQTTTVVCVKSKR